MMRRLILLLLAFASLVSAQAQNPNLPTWEIGQPAPAFFAYDEKGVARSLRELRGKWVVFDVSTTWCLPSYVFAEYIHLVREYLATKGISLASYTLIDQNPLEQWNAGRGQALAWKLEFPHSDIVVGHHIGFTEYLTTLPELYNLIGRPSSNRTYPSWVLLDPDGIVRHISDKDGLLDSPDDILALILPDQPSLGTTIRELDSSFYNPPNAPEVTVKVGKKWGRSRNPRITGGGGVTIIPHLEQGTLSHEHGIGFGRAPSPAQEMITLFYDTYLPKDSSDTGIPTDQDIFLRLRVPRWKGLRPVLTHAEASVHVLDYFSGIPALKSAPVTYQGNDIVVGPFRAGGTLYPPRAVDVTFYVTTPSPRLLAAQGADESLLFVNGTNQTGPILVSQWLAVESAINLPDSVAASNLTLSRLRSLRHTITKASKADLPRAQRLIFLKMVDRLRQITQQERLQLKLKGKTMRTEATK